MYFKGQIRESVYTLLVVILVELAAFGIIVFVTGQATARVLGVVLGTGICVMAALVSRNPRLFCLYGLGFSIPFLFAKTFGAVLDKGGGEVAYNIDVTDLFLFALSAFIALDIVTGRRPGIRIPRVSYFWVGIMLLGVGTVLIGPFRTTATQEVLRMVKMLILFLVLCQELESPRRILHWSAALTSGLLVNAIVGLVQYYYKATLGLAILGEASDKVTKTLAAESVSGVEVWRVGAFLLHPNVFGAFLATLLPLSVACLLLKVGKAQRVYYFLAFVLGIAALLATQSRSGWFSFAGALALCLLLLASHVSLRQRSVLTALSLAILLLGLIAVEHELIANRLFDSREEAVTFRAVFEDDAKRMIAESPLWGWGLNTYVLQLPAFAKYQYGSWPPPVHETYLLWWAETGLIGLAMHLSMWGGIVWTGVRNLRVRDERLYAINAACLAGMFAFALDGFVSFSLRITPTLKTFWVLAAMIMAVKYWRLRHEAYPAAVVRSAARKASAEDGAMVPAGPFYQ